MGCHAQSTTTSLKYIKSMHRDNNKPQTHPNRQARITDVVTLATSSKIAEKTTRETRNRGNRVPNKIVDPTAKLVARETTQHRNAFQVLIGLTDHSGDKPPRLNRRTTSQYFRNHKVST